MIWEPENIETRTSLMVWEPGNTEEGNILMTWEPTNIEEGTIPMSGKLLAVSDVWHVFKVAPQAKPLCSRDLSQNSE